VRHEPLSDYQHPVVITKAADLAAGKTTEMEKLESIFYYVREEIKFGFPPRWDEVRASQTVGYKIGYCNTKATLFLALCKALSIPARVHYGLIDLRIMRGILPAWAFMFLPKHGSHSWIDVRVGGQWKQIDSYIDDRLLYERALERLKSNRQSLGYSVCIADGRSSCEFNFGEKGFVHTGAVVEDHGVWDDASEYFATDRYTRMNLFQRMAFPVLAKLANRNLKNIRSATI